MQRGPREYGRRRYYADAVEASQCVLDKEESGRVYEVYWVKSETVALEYLRRRDVRQEGHYVVITTPGRRLGRDMVTIFDEADGTLIEIPERTPLPELRPSTTHCARCGYPILPGEAVDDVPGDPPESIVEFAQSPYEAVLKGFGYQCTKCGSAACAACYRATGEKTDVVGEGVQMHRCWVCDSPVTAYLQRRQGAVPVRRAGSEQTAKPWLDHGLVDGNIVACGRCGRGLTVKLQHQGQEEVLIAVAGVLAEHPLICIACGQLLCESCALHVSDNPYTPKCDSCGDRMVPPMSR